RLPRPSRPSVPCSSASSYSSPPSEVRNPTVPLNRTAAFTATAAAITLAGIALTGTAALATTPELGTIRGVDGKTVVLEWTVPTTTWPQPVYDGSCAVTVQRDEYPYATEADRKRTDALAAD